MNRVKRFEIQEQFYYFKIKNMGKIYMEKCREKWKSYIGELHYQKLI